jgi:hypothetical protein
MPTRIVLAVTPWSGELVGDPGPQILPSVPNVPVAAWVEADELGLAVESAAGVPALLQPAASTATAARAAMDIWRFTVVLLDGMAPGPSIMLS